MGPNKYVPLLFAIGSLVMAFLLAETAKWIWGYFAKPNELLINGGAVLLAVFLGFVAYRNERMFTAAYDVTHELEKVTWPTRKETSAATVVVIVTVGIASLILAGFDVVWGGLANLVLR
jgi:preprotein translocase subunit SecE